MSGIHLNDTGTRFVVTILDEGSIVDISSATTKDIIFKKPDGTTLTKAANFVTDGTNGKIDYFTISGDLSVIGIWSIQSQVILGSGTWNSDIETFEVFRNLV